MEPERLIAIVGPTASGKTKLAIRIAQRFNGEIICADSRTVYTDMNIGTAKPTPDEQAAAVHHGLDLVRPDERFTAADFKRYAEQTIDDIRSRGKLPIVVGGTGLYVDGLLYDYQFGPQADTAVRSELMAKSIEQLQEYCQSNNIPLPENINNHRHLVRAIERAGINDIGTSALPDNHHIVGIATSMNTLRARISERTEHLFKNGVVEEASMLGKKYGWESEAMTGNIYPLIKKHLAGELTIRQVKEAFIAADYRLAKRQMTWLRRNPDIMWTRLKSAEHYIESILVRE